MEESLAESTIDSATIYEGDTVSLRLATVRLPDGRTATREIVDHSDAVCIVALDGEGNVVLVRQFRTPADSDLLEVPAGGIEDGEVSEEAVLRELQEEIGHTAANLRHLSSFWVAPGWATEYMHAYLATELTPARLTPDDDENIQVVRVPLGQIERLIERGEIRDAKSIASLLLALRLLGDNGSNNR